MSAFKRLLRHSPLGRWWQALRSRRRPRSQGDEAAVLRDLLKVAAIPKVFVEFGFHAHEFNCANLINDHAGLLIDGDGENVARARRVLPPNVTAVQRFLHLGNLDVIVDFCRGRDLGILSVDVDGNDYWFLERLLELRPALVIVEYNASFGLRPLVVPYDKDFLRHAKHESGWYHGASLTALHRLCTRAGYGLVAVTESGCNAFFLRADLAAPGRIIAPETAYRENRLRNEWSKTTAAAQWERIRHLPFVEV